MEIRIGNDGIRSDENSTSDVDEMRGANSSAANTRIRPNRKARLSAECSKNYGVTDS
jgi:hypothetical protein